MADRLALAPTHELPSPDTIAKVLLDGDLSQLTPPQKISLYHNVCDSLGLNPLTKPFDYIRLSGRLVLYATRNCTDQLRKRYAISVTITAREVVEDTYVVTARATMPDGRHDESNGAVPIAGLKGETRSNAMMKCETKAKRRVTLSLVGLSTLDESEIDSIPNAQPVPFDPAPLAKSLTPSPGPVLESAPAGGAEVGAPVVPANLNDSIPAAWKPFVEKSQMSGVIVALDAETRPGPRGDVTKTTVTLDTGECAATVDPTLAATALELKHHSVVIVTQPHKKLIQQIVSITADDDVQL